LYRPTSLLWDGTTTWALLEGHPADVQEQASTHRLVEAAGPPILPEHRCSMPPSTLGVLTGEFVAEVGVGLVHLAEPARPATPREEVVTLHRRIKERFDPTGRLNPGRDPLAT
jgi:glycolate oxidase FAD binding subunit